MNTIDGTEFLFPGQTGVYHGKVRDVYEVGGKVVMVATDRISAFDVVLSRAIPFKGQVLNQLAAYFLEASKTVVPNWLQSVPDPNVSVGLKCQPFMVEMVVRGCLVGSAWRDYQNGLREICGVSLPEGMKQFDKFPTPIITPTTKALAGHDENISLLQVVESGIATQAELDKMVEMTHKLFACGQQMASQRRLFLADTKYEFGKRGGHIYVIDEIHTPDSSRYFDLASYDDFISGKTTDLPEHLSKEFVREWLMSSGFSGQAGQQVPEMTDAVVAQISAKYVQLFERITGKKFEPRNGIDDVLNQIENNVLTDIKGL